jgi:hypothetical protein
MRPTWGSNPGLTDQLIVSRNVTLTLEKRNSDSATTSLQVTEKGDSDWVTTGQQLNKKVNTCESFGSS